MAEIRSTVSEYSSNTVYNMFEIRLSYSMGPNRSYRLEYEDKRATCGAELDKQKHKISVLLCVIADGSQAFHPRHISKSMNLRCFRDSRFAHHGNFYSHEGKGWIGSNEFDIWMKWLHQERGKFCPGPKLLITDNFGEHSVNAAVFDVRIITLPPCTT